MTSQRLVIVVLPSSTQKDRIVQSLRLSGWQARSYTQVDDCLRELRGTQVTGHFCVVSELHGIKMPGLVFQQELKQCCHASSIVFYAERAQPSEIVQAMRQGAVAVVEPTDSMESLLSYVAEGMELSLNQFRREAHCRETLRRLRNLSLGERQVLQGILEGKLNKEIAKSLELSIRTIEQRRREVFRKLDVHHPASLTRKIIQAAQTPRLHSRDDDQTQWLGGLRQDAGHPIGSPRNGINDRYPFHALEP